MASDTSNTAKLTETYVFRSGAMWLPKLCHNRSIFQAPEKPRNLTAPLSGNRRPHGNFPRKQVGGLATLDHAILSNSVHAFGLQAPPNRECSVRGCYSNGRYHGNYITADMLGGLHDGSHPVMYRTRRQPRMCFLMTHNFKGFEPPKPPKRRDWEFSSQTGKIIKTQYPRRQISDLTVNQTAQSTSWVVQHDKISIQDGRRPPYWKMLTML